MKKRVLTLLAIAITATLFTTSLSAQSIDTKMTTEEMLNILENVNILNGNDYLRHYQVDESNLKKAKLIPYDLLMDYVKKSVTLKIDNVELVTVSSKKEGEQQGIKELFFYWKGDQDKKHEQVKEILKREHPDKTLAYIYIEEKLPVERLSGKNTEVNYVMYKYTGLEPEGDKRELNLVFYYSIPTFEAAGEEIYFVNSSGNEKYVDASSISEEQPSGEYTYPVTIATFELYNTERSMYREAFKFNQPIGFNAPKTFSIGQDKKKEFKVQGPKALNELQVEMYQKARERGIEVEDQVANREAYIKIFGNYQYESIETDLQTYKDLLKTREEINSRKSTTNISIRRF